MKKLNETTPTYTAYHELITVPINGYKDGYEYVKDASPYYRIPYIKVPTMFLNALNDPFMGEKVIDYEIFK